LLGCQHRVPGASYNFLDRSRASTSVIFRRWNLDVWDRVQYCNKLDLSVSWSKWNAI
jgi:hypothetical protein